MKAAEKMRVALGKHLTFCDEDACDCAGLLEAAFREHLGAAEAEGRRKGLELAARHIVVGSFAPHVQSLVTSLAAELRSMAEDAHV